MKKIQFFVIAFVFLIAQLPFVAAADSSDYRSKTKAEIKETNRRVGAAFKAGDIDTILLYHHPKVEKFLGWDNIQIGHQDMRDALQGMIDNYSLVFDNPPEWESFTANAETASMITRFKLRGVPKNDTAEAWEYEGRTMILYIRNPESPTGWQTLREMIMSSPQ